MSLARIGSKGNSLQPNTLVSGEAVSTFPALSDGHYQAILTAFDDGFGSDYAPAMVFRFTDNNNYWMVQLEMNNGVAHLYSRVTGTFTIQATLTYPLVSLKPYTVDIFLAGNSIGFTVNGASLTSVSNGFNVGVATHGVRSGVIASPTGKSSYNNLSFWS